MIASSSSWRSSLRMSRSPTQASVSVRSSPSSRLGRGKIPSSRPSRQTTRCGTDRIGSIVHMVRVPVRKLARVGRPRKVSASRADTSANPSSRSAASALSASSASRPSSAYAWLSCQLSVGGTAVSSCSASLNSATQLPSDWRSATGVGDRADPVHALGEPADQVDIGRNRRRPSASVVPMKCCSVSSMATPSSSRSSPAVQVFCAKASIPYRARWGPSSPHRTPDATTSSCSRSRSSVRKPNLRLTGAVAHRSSRRARLHPRFGQPDQPGDRREQRIELSQRAVGQPDPEPVPGMLGLGLGTVEPEGRGDQRREGLDVGAHDDDVAGLEGRVVGQQSHQQFAEHLDLTVGPVRGVELDAPVVPLQQVAVVVGRQPSVRGEV